MAKKTKVMLRRIAAVVLQIVVSVVVQKIVSMLIEGGVSRNRRNFRHQKAREAPSFRAGR